MTPQEIAAHMNNLAPELCALLQAVPQNFDVNRLSRVHRQELAAEFGPDWKKILGFERPAPDSQ